MAPGGWVVDSSHPVGGARGNARMRRRGTGRRQGGARRRRTRGSGEGPVSRVLSRAVISLGRRLPVASSDRPGSHSGPDQPDKAPCLILLPVGFTKPSRSPGLLVRSYRTVSPLPPGTPEGPRSAVCSLWHFPYPCGRWALPTTVSCGARTFLHAAGSFRPRPKDPSTRRPLGPLRPLLGCHCRCPRRRVNGFDWSAVVPDEFARQFDPDSPRR